jgi:hypothetical protein
MMGLKLPETAVVARNQHFAKSSEGFLAQGKLSEVEGSLEMT